MAVSVLVIKSLTALKAPLLSAHQCQQLLELAFSKHHQNVRLTCMSQILCADGRPQYGAWSDPHCHGGGCIHCTDVYWSTRGTILVQVDMPLVKYVALPLYPTPPHPQSSSSALYATAAS